MIKFDKFTIKAQEAIGEAQQIATSYNHQEIKSDHLLLALINQKDGVIPSILQKLEVNSEELKVKLERLLEKIPQVYGGSGGQHIGKGLNDILNTAQREAQKVKEFLAEKGYDPHYGSRPLKRTIQRFIQDPLALQILEGVFKEGDKLETDLDKTNEKIVFKKM